VIYPEHQPQSLLARHVKREPTCPITLLAHSVQRVSRELPCVLLDFIQLELFAEILWPLMLLGSTGILLPPLLKPAMLVA